MSALQQNNNEEVKARKKVFFVLSSLTSGGSERVFWNLAQGFNKDKFEITIVILDSTVNCFSMDLDGVRFIDLKTKKASRSFFALYAVLKREAPYAVFSTTDHINILVSLVGRFLNIPMLIARASNIPHEQRLYEGFKSKFYELFASASYRGYKQIVCQSDEMKQSLIDTYNVDQNLIKVIANPVLLSNKLKGAKAAVKIYKLLVVARFALEKGLDRLVEIMAGLPENYHLDFVGTGVLKDQIAKQIADRQLGHRLKILGEIKNIHEVMVQHDLMVLSSHTEGFPNVVLEALTVGLPVVTFKVSGIPGLIIDGFNGYVIKQGDLEDFRQKIIQACTIDNWKPEAIRQNVYQKCALDKISAEYEELIS
ncbi:glycosyltransferase [Pedobacter soli]|uniref:Glycosyltransferase involved in cell wall bisynthesis n=1 Tax=Pedobacter soli TaxID=390242 RepID=A0A1G6SSG2_9SPHI|nr:glycosyltransferase [Pedobacter soli]SDD19763.1 Glycosyltransferase involved in cell wall bisynthesis [Pedobacter soli]